MKKLFKGFTMITIDIVFFLVGIMIFVMGSLLNSMVSTTLVRSLSPDGFMQTAIFFILQKLPQYFVIALAGYLASLVSCLMLYFDKYLIRNDDLDKQVEPLETTRILIYTSAIVGLLIVCFFYTESRDVYITDLKSVGVFFMEGQLVQDLLDNVRFWWNPSTENYNSLNRTIAELLSMIIEIGVFLFFFLFKPTKVNKNKKLSVFM